MSTEEIQRIVSLELKRMRKKYIDNAAKGECSAWFYKKYIKPFAREALNYINAFDRCPESTVSQISEWYANLVDGVIKNFNGKIKKDSKEYRSLSVELARMYHAFYIGWEERYVELANMMKYPTPSSEELIKEFSADSTTTKKKTSKSTTRYDGFAKVHKRATEYLVRKNTKTPTCKETLEEIIKNHHAQGLSDEDFDPNLVIEEILPNDSIQIVKGGKIEIISKASFSRRHGRLLKKLSLK